MPPPAEASTRISAISSCIFCCIFWACCIMACMFPGIFIFASPVFQISHGSYLAVREQFLEALHFGMLKRTDCRFVWLRKGRRRGRYALGFADFYRDLDGPSDHLMHDRGEVAALKVQRIQLRRGD